jgi:hypothetical protein
MKSAGSTSRGVGWRKQARGITIGYWIATSLFALQMAFTAYAQLRLPQVAAAFTHLGFPAYFRIELSWLKFAGILVLLFPAPKRLKEWAYAGFAITLGSALVAHLSVGDDVSAWSWAAGTAVLWGISYYCWRRLQSEPAATRDVASAGYVGRPAYPEPGV